MSSINLMLSGKVVLIYLVYNNIIIIIIPDDNKKGVPVLLTCFKKNVFYYFPQWYFDCKFHPGICINV